MGSESLLRAACEMAFTVARDGYEADPSIESPESMRSFLYVARLPRRAITVAQKVLENDESFRGRVAAAVTPEEVGQAGYIWLHRPEGWEAEFERLKQGAGSEEVKQAVAASGSVPSRQIPTIPPPPGFEPGQFANEPGQVTNGNAVSDTNTNAKDDMGDVNAIEHELSSLRGLVDRLAGERQTVNDAGDKDKTDGVPLISPSGVSKVESSEGNEQLLADIDKAVRDRDEARRKHSESLTHQLELEKELTKLRQGQNSVDAAQAENEARLVEIRKELARVTANRDEAERQRKATVEQMTGLNHEINRLRGDAKASAATSSQLEKDIATHVTEKKAAQDDLEQASARTQRLVVTNEDLSRRLVEGEQEIERLRVELDGFADLARRSETLQAEADDLAEQLANERTNVESAQSELVKSHSKIDRFVGEVNDVKGERDSMAQQVATLQESLSEALTDLSESRVSRDAERISTQEYRAERDELKVELARLQEVDSEQSAKLDGLLAEQSAHMSLKQRSSELEERVLELDSTAGKLKTDLTRVVSERDKATGQLASQTEELNELRTDVGRLNQETSSSASALMKTEGSLEEVRVERETLATQLAEAEQRTASAETQATKFQEQLEEALSNLGAIQAQIENQQTEIESSSSQVTLERERANEYKVAAETHEKALQALTNKSNEDQEAVKGAAAELETERKNLERANASLVKAKEDLERSQKELQKSGGELSKTQEELRKAKIELTDTKADLANAKSGLTAVTNPAKQTDEQVNSIAQGSSDTTKSGSTQETATGDKPDQKSADLDSQQDAHESVNVSTADVEPGPLSISDSIDSSGLKIVEDIPDVDSDVVESNSQDDATTTTSEISDGSGVASLIRSVPDGDEDDSAVTDDTNESRPKSLRRPPSVLDTNSAAEASDNDDDELDVLGDILSRKVTSFSGSEASEESDPQVDRDDVTFFGKRGEENDSTIGRPPSVFTTSELDALDAARNADDSDVTFQPPADTPISAISPLKSPSDDGEASLVANDRRKVEIPADIVSRGGVELARFVVESPEVVLLVDGDGVAKMGWSSRSVGEQREALVSWLADLTASTGASSDVVFDGRLGDDSALPASRVVSIRLSTPPTEPAAALDELVDAYPPQFPIAVVTDNTALKEAAQKQGAVALSNAQLLDLFTPE